MKIKFVNLFASYGLGAYKVLVSFPDFPASAGPPEESPGIPEAENPVFAYELVT